MTNTPGTLSALLQRHDLQLKKSLGQNFLADPVHLQRIVAAAELTRADTVVEVGPGAGTLTARLAEAAGQVVAVELDQRLLPLLHETLRPYDNVTVIHGDVLQLDPAALTAPLLPPERSFKVVANLPYYITSAAIRHLLTAVARPELLVLTIQREVAQRIVAQPPEMSLLAVSVQFYSRPDIVARIPAGAFYPPPKVDSAILRLRPWPAPPVKVPDEAAFFRVARAGFGQRRKQLRNSLRSGLELPQDAIDALLTQAGVDGQRRAETLTLAEWARLSYAAVSGDLSLT